MDNVTGLTICPSVKKKTGLTIFSFFSDKNDLYSRHVWQSGPTLHVKFNTKMSAWNSMPECFTPHASISPVSVLKSYFNENLGCK